VQAAKAPPSSWHWKLEPGSFELKPKLGALSLLGSEGEAVMVAIGGVVSTLNTGRTTKSVASTSTRTFQSPSLPPANAGHGRIS
jgi:hypothetical protein